MGTLVEVQFGDGSYEPALTKKQLGAHPAVRKSPRWIEMRTGEGMPSWMEGKRRMFHLSQVTAWMEDNGFLPGGSGPPPRAGGTDAGGAPRASDEAVGDQADDETDREPPESAA